MNAVEIEEAVTELVEEKPFDPAEFPYHFLEAFGNRDTTLKRLRKSGKSSTNKTDVTGDGVHAVLQRSNIHLATCPPGEVAATLTALRDSPASAKQRAKYLLATDGAWLEAEQLTTGETLACGYAALPDHFAFFLELAGI